MPSIAPERESDSSPLIDDRLFMREENLVDLKRRLQRDEWRQRNACFARYGKTQAPRIIRPGKDRPLR